jgi:flagellar motor protein MotB
VCAKNLGSAQASAGDSAKQLETSTGSLGAATLKATELEKQNTEFSKNLNASKDELSALRAQKAEADKRMAAIEDIRKQFAKMIDTGQLRVTARRGQLVLSLPSEVLFPTGSAELSKQGEYAVVEVGAVLKKFPDRRFLVVGHTDNQDFVKPKGQPATPVCTPTDNWQLSAARADRHARARHRRHGREEPGPGRRRRERSHREQHDRRGPPEESPHRDRAVARDQRAAALAREPDRRDRAEAIALRIGPRSGCTGCRRGSTR